MLTGKDVSITDTSRFWGDVDIENMPKITGYYNTHGQYLAHYSVSRQKDTARIVCGAPFPSAIQKISS